MTTGFPDLPIDPLRGVDTDNQDLLGLDAHADALKSFVCSCSTPMTVGIQGDWGSGKTSLMNLIRAKLGDNHALNIWFNTWQYAQFGNEETLASSMLINLMQKVKRTGKPTKSVWHNASRFVRAVAQATTVGGPGVTIAGRDLLDGFSDESDLDEAGLFEQMKADFSAVVRDVIANESNEFERVVIFIDDLDRLSPAKAVELLEAVKNLIDVEGCVFLLAIDYDVVIRGLRQKKGLGDDEGQDHEGKNFFDKIIQVPYRMPVERYTTRDFLQNHFERVYGELSEREASFFEEFATELIRLSVGNNPRSLKRALNIHALFSHLMNVGRELEEVDDNEHVLTFVFACVQVALPRMYAMISRQERPLHALVALRSPGLYRLASQTTDEESADFGAFVDEIVEELDAIVEDGFLIRADDDDDGDSEQRDALVALLEGLLRDLRRGAARGESVGLAQRMRKLADIALQAIDIDGNETYSSYEIEVLGAALNVAKSTSIETQVVEDAPVVRKRRNVSFKEIAESLPQFLDKPALLFWDVVENVVDPDYKRAPDYVDERNRFYVVVDGVTLSLKEETLRILASRQDRGIREMTNAEADGRIPTTSYWVLENDPEQRLLKDHKQEWKEAITEVNTRTQVGRERLDARVLAHLGARSGFVAASEVREAVGATSIQVRTSLNRLIEAGKVTWKGKARGTRYKLA